MLWPHARGTQGGFRWGTPKDWVLHLNLTWVKQHPCALATRTLPSADLGWIRLALVHWGQNCTKRCANNIDNQVPVSVLGTVEFVSRAVSCDGKDHLIPKIRNPLALVIHDNAELFSSLSCTVFISQLGRRVPFLMRCCKEGSLNPISLPKLTLYPVGN